MPMTCTLIAVVPSPGIRVTVAWSLTRDLSKVSDWYDHWKINSMRVRLDYDSLQVTHNAFPVTTLTIGGTVLKESDDLDILGVKSDSKMTFEKHLRSVSRAASQRLGILRENWQYFMIDCFLIGRCLRGFVLPVLENYSTLWCSAADTHLN